MTCWWVVLRQEWAAANSVALPVRDQRANTTSYYRFEEEVPTNILQVRTACCSLLLTALQPAGSSVPECCSLSEWPEEAL